MACNNCYNGCVETTSDKCVRYTGSNVESLAIDNGDSLYVVEQALIAKIVSFLDGTGIKINIPIGDYCTLVTQYLPPCFPACGDPSAKELFTALVKAACDLQTQVDGVEATLATLNANYTIGCLTGVTASSDTHDIVQAVITKLCELGVDLAALALDVDTNYVKLADLNNLITAYLASLPSSNAYRTKMVPYTVVEYYGSLANFDVTGAGLGDWQQIYLCNGNNGTPDKRGRTAVGAIVGMGGGPLSSTVNPAVAGNPNYSLLTTAGSNSVTLDVSQIPSHTHALTDPGHSHTFEGAIQPGGGGESTRDGVQATLNTSTATTGITMASTGGGLAHTNIQPSLACYYIMYIPTP